MTQNYPAFDVLAVDDRSVDATGAILDSIAANDPRLRVLHIEPGSLPAGWLGKCHALARGVEQLGPNVPWILFMDSDVTLQPGALTVAMSNALQRKYDAVSLLTALQCHSFAERLVLPLAGAAWSFMFLVARTNDDDQKKIAAANGQFFLIRREAYESVGGHAAVRDQITEDVELMRRLKQADYRARLCFGDHLAATRMHSTVRQMIHGWGRIFSGTARRKSGPMIAGIVFILIAGFSVWPALIYGLLHSDVWLIAAIVHWLLMTGYAVIVYGQTGQSRWNALLFPLGQAALLILYGYGIRMSRTGRVIWRDTHYANWTPASRASDAIADRSPPKPGETANDVHAHNGVPIPPESSPLQ